MREVGNANLQLTPHLPDFTTIAFHVRQHAGGGAEKENVPRNLSLVFQQHRPLLSDMLATPPPQSSAGRSLRIEAPCFVPGGVPEDASSPYSGDPIIEWQAMEAFF